MASKRISIRLPNDLLERCYQFGKQIVAELANPTNQSTMQSAALSSHGAQNDLNLQIDAKAAECAFCLWVGLEPETALHWNNHADTGFDVTWYTTRIDVKHTRHDNGSLIWPIKKQHLYLEKMFDAFVLVTGHDRNFNLVGWVTKDGFLANHRIAQPGLNLTVGTWYLMQHRLREMEELEDWVQVRADIERNL